MWIDSASEIDMLSYRPFAELLYRIINDKRMNPLTIGLYGSWGAGKSTILKLTENIIENSDSQKKIACVNVNSWMFEGYDDAKHALMESLLRGIENNKRFEKINKDKIKGLIKRIDFLKLGANIAKKGIPLAMSLATGNPIPFMFNISSDMLEVFKSEEGIQGIYDGFSKLSNEYIKPKENEETSLVKNIRAFKEEFEALLIEANIDNLVVMIDDLDRCTPDKIIDTLEAIKLFLSVPRTTFIVAVDERVIRYSIKKKYPVIDAESVDISKDYIEKIIQLPINIPELSEIDIMNYMLLLVNELYLEKDLLNKLINKLYQEGSLFNRSRITSNKIFSIIENEIGSIDNLVDCSEYKQLIDVVEKTSMIVACMLKGNPRQAKRFLNTFLVRKNMATIYYGNNSGIRVDILAKLLALEYVDVDLFRKLNEWNNKADSEIKELKELITIVDKGDDIPTKYSLWDNRKIKNWLLSEPIDIYNENLNKYFYLCRESLSGDINNIESLNEEEKTILKEIINSPRGKEKDNIVKLHNMNQDSVNKIIKVIIRMFKDKRGRTLNIAIIYNEFEAWRCEILEHISKYTKSDIDMKIIVPLQMMYKQTPQDIDKILEVWYKNKWISEQSLKSIRGE